MSTTEAKRDVIDYLWVWAEGVGNWAKLLVQKVVQREGGLSEDERSEIYAAFLHDLGLGEEGKETPEITRPTFSASEADIELVKISNIFGVNRLASGQSLEFSPNMTVVYGENGTGKTGYGRVLKNFGYCYDAVTNIHPDVNGDCDCKQSALIDYNAGGSNKIFTWDGVNKCIDLTGISFFNNNCVHLSLDSERNLLVSPIGFHLFTVLTDELDDLSKLHKSKINSTDTFLSWEENLHEGTEVQKLINSLSKDTTDEEVDALSSFTGEHEADLKAKKEEVKKANKELIEKEIRELNQHISELDRVKKVVELHKEEVSEESLSGFAASLFRLEELKNKEQVGIKDIVEEKGVELYESPEFMAFIKAADQYITRLGKEDYPSGEDEVCVYCRQKLSEKSAFELLQSYRKVLNDTTQQDIRKVERSIEIFANKIDAISEDNKFHLAVYGVDENSAVVQPDFICKYNSAITKLKKIVSGQDTKEVESYELGISFENIVSSLTIKMEGLDVALKDKKDTLSKLEDVESSLLKEINELEDRKKLSEKKTEVVDIIAKFKVKHVLESISKPFSSRAISGKTTSARNDLVAGEFQELFNSELKNFRRSTTPVEMSFKTDKGQSKIVQSISDSYKLNEILSEGEQKAIALAEFLTELQFDKGKSPVVFDDPVTSLDHKIIEEVARRLLKLSQKRQVVIFTHSILLLNSIKQICDVPSYSKVKLKMYEVLKDEKNTGFLYEMLTPKEETFKKYKSEINGIFNLPAEERAVRRDQLAIKGYGKLRSAIEIIVEKHILCDTVKRYRRNVALTSFERINVEKLEKHRERLSAIFSRCCSFIDGHTNPDEIPDKPDLDSLKIDFDEVLNIFEDFK